MSKMFSVKSERNTGLLLRDYLADSSVTQEKVSASLEQVWNEAPLGYYGGKNSYKITTATGEVQMQFATSTDETIITGRIKVIGFK